MEVAQYKVKFLKDGSQYGYRTPAGEEGTVYDADIDWLLANKAVEVIETPIPEQPEVKTKKWNFQLKQWEYETSNPA